MPPQLLVVGANIRNYILFYKIKVLPVAHFDEYQVETKNINKTTATQPLLS